MTTATLTINGTRYPLNQATVRRDADPPRASLDCQIVGPHAFSVGDAVLFEVSGAAAMAGLIETATPDARMTRISAELTAASGVGAWPPGPVQYRSTGLLRVELDFDIHPGHTWQGSRIKSVTHTIGAGAPWFSELRF